MADSAAFIWLGLALVILQFVQQRFQRSLQSALLLLLRRPDWALIFYSLLFLPGTALHEFSHWLAARLVGVRVRSFSLLPERMVDGRVRFGYVETDSSDPVRAALIGAAPVAAGTLAVGFLGFRILGLDALAQASMEFNPTWVVEEFGRIWSTGDLLVWIYLVVAISNTMLPSRSDRATWVAAAAIILVLVIGVFAMGGGDLLAERALPALQRGASAVAAVFSLTAVLDLLLLLPLGLSVKLLERATGLRAVT